MSLIRLHVPGSLEFRNLAVRVVEAACKLVTSGSAEARATFEDHVISAFGEAFNNAAIHSYRGRSVGTVEIEIDVVSDAITLRIADYGQSFDPTSVAEPDLDALPESGLGLYIMRSFMDSLDYQPKQAGEAGAPNVLSMTKRLQALGSSEGGPR